MLYVDVKCHTDVALLNYGSSIVAFYSCSLLFIISSAQCIKFLKHFLGNRKTSLQGLS